MKVNEQDHTISFSTKEPFGQLLLDTMYSKSSDIKILDVQKHIGSTLLGAYLDSELEDIDDIEDVSEKTIVYDDVSRDIALKTDIFARNRDVDIVFSVEHLDGLEKLAQKEASDLPVLIAEREVSSVAKEIGYKNRHGRKLDDQDINLIDEDIEQAKEALIVLDALKYLRSLD